MDPNTDADNNNAVAQVPAVPAAVPMDPPAAVNLPDDVVDAPDAVAAPPPAIHAVAPDIPAQITELGARVDQMQGSLTTILTQLAVLADPSRFRTAGSPSPVAPPAPPSTAASLRDSVSLHYHSRNSLRRTCHFIGAMLNSMLLTCSKPH